MSSCSQMIPAASSSGVVTPEMAHRPSPASKQYIAFSSVYVVIIGLRFKPGVFLSYSLVGSGSCEHLTSRGSLGTIRPFVSFRTANLPHS